MMHRVWYQVTAITILILGLSSICAFASNSAEESQEHTVRDVHSEAMRSTTGQSQTQLPDGRLLLIGGMESGSPTNRVYFKDSQTGTLSEASGTLLQSRAFHSATLLPNGKIFIFGGVGDGASTLSQAEVYDPVAQVSSNASSSGLSPRSHQSVTLLTDGRVLIAGGINSDGMALSQIDIWDYRTGMSSTLSLTLSVPLSDQTATLMPDGTVLLWGGIDANGNHLTGGEIIDPITPVVRLVSSTSVQLNSLAPLLEASSPQNGENGIAITQLIALRFSKPLAMSSFDATTVTLSAQYSNVAINVIPAEGGMLGFITPQGGVLANGTTYTLYISGATDTTGLALPNTTILFTTVVSSANTDTGSTSSTTDADASGITAGNAGGLSSEWRKLPALKALPGVTSLTGQVLTLDGSPLPNVLVQVDSQQATTDKTGRFLVQNTGSGHHVMIVDGGTANTKSNSYGLYRIGVELKDGQTNSLNYTVWMTALDTEHVVQISSPTTSDIVVTNPTVPGVELHIPAGTIIHDAYGKVVTQVGITQIPTSQPPFPIKRGLNFPIYFTAQPGGATFVNAGNAWSPMITGKAKGATIHYKNYSKAKAGSRFAFWNYDPNQRGWYSYGKGTVSSDAKKVVPEARTQITSFDAASMGGGPPNGGPPNPNKPSDPSGGEPVIIRTGIFNYSKTDISLSDVMPLVLSRSYRPADYVSRDFGIGSASSFSMYLVGDSWDTSSATGWTFQDLYLADGTEIPFVRTSVCDSSGYCGLDNAVFTAVSMPGEYYGATVKYGGSDQYWTMTKKDGTVIQFNGYLAAENTQCATPLWIKDRNGNTVTFTRTSDRYCNLIKVASPNGRWIQFTSDSSNRITGAQDNIGRTTSYTYNSAGYLATATDVNGGVTNYSYDSDGNMISIQDSLGIVYLQNQYDENDRVSLQTQADGSTYQFAYTTDLNGNAVQTNVTDQRGYVRSVTFNSEGFTTSDTHAVGMPEQQTISYSPQQGTGLILSQTDALNRQTNFSYDAMGNVTSITKLAGTTSAVTTNITYSPQFYELSTVTDPLGNMSAYTYDSNGNMLTSVDPLGDTTTYTYNSAGQPVTVTDAQGNQSQYAYNLGNLVSITDPLGRAVTRFVDGAGRVATVTDPLGHTTRTNYDAASQVLSVIDPLGNKTAFGYDGNGNLLTLTDANQHATAYTYENMDRVQTRTDPLGNVANAKYDLSGNMIQSTDRKGQVTKTTYDGLNRPTTVQYADGNSTTYTYDAGNRVTGITDSANGTIARSYDGLDRLLAETTSQGSVAYTYDADGRRQTMTVSGQVPVSYTYDNASHLTAIAQSASNVGFTYDSDGRRSSLTLPNGVVATYSYDAASQITGINYQGGALGAANLTYSYDLTGRRIGVGGSLASTQLPATVSSAVYNANNELTQWGSTAMNYDANGNTVNDGMNSYVWDARNRLVSADNNGATFTYDPLGRRVGKQILSASTDYLYEGANLVQERSNGAVTANLLTGGVDERFVRTDSTGSFNYLTDALGSTVALIDSTGASVEQYSYGPYGMLSASGSSSNSYTYTGRETDGLGIDFYRARYYNPTTGRFLSEDPIGFRGGINKYAYVGGSPTNFIDPSGMDKKNPFQCASDTASKVSLASLTGLGDAGGVTGFAANALGGNAFSGLTDLGTSLVTGSGGGHSVFYNMGQGVAAGPTQGFGAAFGSSIEGTPWASGPADVATNAILKAVNSGLNSGSELTTLFGEASSAGLTGAEYATGVGELKLGYDAATYGLALAGCGLGLL